METKEKRLCSILLQTVHLPKQVIYHSSRPNTAEFVLHSLSHPNCFNLTKAAYFIDNPDFDLMKGVAGYHDTDSYRDDHWANPDMFSSHMQNMNFNQKVRELSFPSVQRRKKDQKEMAQELALTLGIQDPQFCSWPTKYENYGFLVYQKLTEEEQEEINDYLAHGLYLLGFCPIF